MATELDISDITTGEIDGTGAFDVLMKTVALHLEREYANGRITGDRYAQSYTEALIATLDQASRFVVSSAQVTQSDELTQAQIDKIYKEIEVMGVQMDQIVAGTAQTEAQTAQIASQTALIEAQTDVANKSIEMTDAQIRKIDSDTQVNDAQVQQIQKSIEVSTAQITQMGIQNSLTTAQTAQVTKQTELTTAQIAKVGADTSLVGTQEQLVTYQGHTEQAKYLDTVNGAVVTGVVGKQKEVYTAQAKGFRDSALQAAAKTVIDTWSVRRTTDEATKASPTSGLQDTNIGSAVEQMFLNLQIPYDEVPDGTSPTT